jgi:membrane-associated phospholipid phosphatase
MGLTEFVGWLVAGVVVMLVTAGVAFVDGERAAGTARRPTGRIREIAPHVLLVLAVLLLNRSFRHLGQEISWLIGLNLTSHIYAVEGDLVATVQTAASPPLTLFFSVVYLHGYVFLTVFPVVAYVVLEDAGPIRKLLVAYATNYALGLALYVLFIAYGPRNLLPVTVHGLLYTAYPDSMLLTSTINANTNAFPSLHTSLAMTVALLAYRTREQYPGWLVLCVPLTAAVLVSTVYLGIHWATDVVAGVVVAAVSVRVADRHHELSAPFDAWSSVPHATAARGSGADAEESASVDDRR